MVSLAHQAPAERKVPRDPVVRLAQLAALANLAPLAHPDLLVRRAPLVPMVPL